MRKILLFTIIYSSYLFAEECPTPLPLDGQPVMVFAETKCLNDNFTKEKISQNLVKSKSTKTFCKSCNNHIMKLSLSNDEESQKTISLYSEAVMGELKKELSLITVDLMKMRSSFSVPFESDLTQTSCNFENLKTPTCLNKPESQQFKSFEKLKLKSQNIMATELANLLSSSPNFEDGLFQRSEKSTCGLKANQIFYTQMRYYESLITPELITELKKIDLKDDQTFKESLESSISSKQIQMAGMRGTMSFLSSHPIMSSILKSPSELKAFLSSVGDKDSHPKIIQKLYQSKQAKGYSGEIANRCAQALSKTSEMMEKVFCETQKPVIADDATTMALLNGKNFSRLGDGEAEASLQRHCAILNNQIDKNPEYTKFSEVLSINQKNDPALFTLPIKDFQTNAFAKMIGNDEKELCKAIEDKNICRSDPSQMYCRMREFHEQTQNDKSYHELASTSDPKINDVLRAFIGKGLPQNNGSTDFVALKILQDEGILPGGASPAKTSAIRDAGNFYDSFSKAPLKQNQNTGSSPKIANSSAQANFQPKNDYPSNTDNSKSDQQGQSTSMKDSKVASKATGKFSNLSDDEQKKVMNFFRNAKTKSTNLPAGIEPEAKNVQNTSFAEAAKLEENATPIGNQLSNSPRAGYTNPSLPTVPKNAELTPEKKSRANDTFNKALLNANLKREPSSMYLDGGPTLMMSKSKEGVNEVDIKVAEEEFKKINLFKEKLKDLLTAHGQELAVVEQGETIIIKLNDYEIVVSYNKDLKIYEARSKNNKLPDDYLKTITNYFNVNLKGSPGKRDALIKTFKITQNQKTP